MDSKKYYYYNHFLGEVVRIAEWKYDEAKKIVHYRIFGTNDWEADTMPLEDPKFCDNEDVCNELAQQYLENECLKYNCEQISCIATFISAVKVCYDQMDIISWQKVREQLGKDKCNTLSEVLKWHDDKKENDNDND